MMYSGDMRSRAFLMCISRRGREERRASVGSLRADRATMVPEITTSLPEQSCLMQTGRSHHTFFSPHPLPVLLVGPENCGATRNPITREGVL
jgi:hypothetical protein